MVVLVTRIVCKQRRGKALGTLQGENYAVKQGHKPEEKNSKNFSGVWFLCLPVLLAGRGWWWGWVVGVLDSKLPFIPAGLWEIIFFFLPGHTVQRAIPPLACGQWEWECLFGLSESTPLVDVTVICSLPPICSLWLDLLYWFVRYTRGCGWRGEVGGFLKMNERGSLSWKCFPFIFFTNSPASSHHSSIHSPFGGFWGVWPKIMSWGWESIKALQELRFLTLTLKRFLSKRRLTKRVHGRADYEQISAPIFLLICSSLTNWWEAQP